MRDYLNQIKIKGFEDLLEQFKNSKEKYGKIDNTPNNANSADAQKPHG